MTPKQDRDIRQADWAELLRRVEAGLPVRTHSGRVEPGDVFVALPGANVDGAAYIGQAVENGAAYVVAAAAQGLPEGASAALLEREDPREALGELARARYGTAELAFPLVGVTGTNGKTTVACLLEHLFASAGRRTGLMGTVRYRWPGHDVEASMTTPDCLGLHAMLAGMAETGVEAAFMEVSSHALHQNRVAGVSYDAAVLTNVTQDHLDYHPDMEQYFAAKSLLFTRQPKADKAWIVNQEDPYGRRLLELNPDAVGYGLSGAPSGRRAVTGRIAAMNASELVLETSFEGRTWEVRSLLVGRHNAMNLLAAQAVGLLLGLEPEDMRAFEGFHGVPGRLERVPNDKGLDVFVDYAHTPDALTNVLAAVRGLCLGRLIVVFGCGGDRDRSKRPLMGRAVCEQADLAVITSDNPRTEDPLAIIEDIRPGLGGCADVLVEPDRRRAIEAALERMEPGRDVCVIAGKGHEDYQIVGREKLPFSDVAAVRDALGEGSA